MTIKVDTRNLDKKLRKLISEQPIIVEDTLKGMAVRVEEEIVRRTRDDGTDQNGTRFKPYAKSTIKQKKRKKATFSRVTLTDEGPMLNSVSVERVDRLRGRAVIGIARRREQIKALRHVRGQGKMPKRDFMGITEDFVKKLQKFARFSVTRRLNKIGRQ